MKDSICAVVVLINLSLFSITSCSGPDQETRTIASVSPYSTLTDEEIKGRYVIRLVELQSLNKEMESANGEQDFATVHRKATLGLERAYDARKLARHLDDPAERAKRLSGIGKIIKDLEHLVEITS